jgi:hypothetical protein
MHIRFAGPVQLRCTRRDVMLAGALGEPEGVQPCKMFWLSQTMRSVWSRAMLTREMKKTPERLTCWRTKLIPLFDCIAILCLMSSAIVPIY